MAQHWGVTSIVTHLFLSIDPGSRHSKVVQTDTHDLAYEGQITSCALFTCDEKVRNCNHKSFICQENIKDDNETSSECVIENWTKYKWKERRCSLYDKR